MLERRNPVGKLNAISPNGFAVGVGVVMPSELALPFVNGFLKLKSKLDFFTLNDGVRLDATQKRGGKSAGNSPHMLWAMHGVSSAVVVAVPPASECLLQEFNNGFVAQPHRNVELHTWMAFGANSVVETCNTNIAFTVEQTGGVTNVEFHRALDEKLANSEKARCPAERRGRVTPNQAGANAPGVRREQVPTAKAKICSELHRNMQRAAEMIAPITRTAQPRHTCNGNRLQFQVPLFPSLPGSEFRGFGR